MLIYIFTVLFFSFHFLRHGSRVPSRLFFGISAENVVNHDLRASVHDSVTRCVGHDDDRTDGHEYSSDKDDDDYHRKLIEYSVYRALACL